MTETSLAQCIAYIVAVNVITAVWVYVGHLRQLTLPTMALAMFFPAIAALYFCDSVGSFIIRVLGIHQPLEGMIYSCVAVYAVAAMVGACVVVDLVMGWASVNEEKKVTAVHGHNSTLLKGFIRACGEEVGWRCFLLPALMEHFSPGVALFITGIAWGLFHVPVLILMTSRLSPPKPIFTVVVQCASVAVAAFPHGWVAIKSGYSVWAPGLMHGVWNQVNPLVLGSIYTQTPGMLRGEQWLINGEGLVGVLVIVPLACWISITL